MCVEKDMLTTPNRDQYQKLTTLLFHARELQATSRHFTVRAPDRQNMLHHDVNRLPAARDWNVLRCIAQS
jgi:hypothetical protein